MSSSVPRIGVGATFGRGVKTSQGNEELKAILSDWPIARPTDWVRLVNEALTDKEAEGIRACIARNRPYGNEAWQSVLAKLMGLLHTMRGEGRPKAIDPKN
jgi:hypothetical protein